MNKFAKFAAPVALIGGMGAAALGFGSGVAGAATGSEASDLLTAQCGDNEIKGSACHNTWRGPIEFVAEQGMVNVRLGESRATSRGQVNAGVRVTPGGFNAPSGAPEPWEWDYDGRAAGNLPRANSGGPGYGG